MDIRFQMEQFNACFCKITELYREWAKKHGMSYNAMMTIYALDQAHGHTTQKQIADGWMIPKQTVNTIVKDLEKRGLVCFKALPGSKQKAVCFTAEGKVFAENCLHELYEMEDRVMQTIGRDACAAYLETGLAFAAALEQEVAQYE